jgi:hypothetical protein
MILLWLLAIVFLFLLAAGVACTSLRLIIHGPFGS